MKTSSLARLTASEQEIARRCLAFVVGSTELDGEFQTRLGVTRAEAAEVLMRWPPVDDGTNGAAAAAAIHNALNEVANGLRLHAADWRSIGATRPQVAACLERYAAVRAKG